MPSPQVDYLEDDADLLPPDTDPRYLPVVAPAPVGDDEHEYGYSAPVPAQSEILSPEYSRALEWRQRLADAQPVLTQPKWWQRALGAAAGAGAGYSNAAGRTRHPIDIETMSENILHPGYKSKLERWRSMVAPADEALKLEGDKQAAWWKGRAANTEEAYKQAETNRANKQGAMYENRANQERNRYSVDPKTGAIFDRVTGETKTPAPTMAERKKLAFEATGDEAMANYYAVNGSLAGYGSTLASPKADHKASSPAEVLMDPDASPEQKKIAQGLFDKQHREARDPNAPKQMTPGQKVQIERRHGDRYAALARNVATMLKNEPDNEEAIREWEKQQKQQIENDYAGEIAAATGNDITPYNYDATSPVPRKPAPTGGNVPRTVKVWDPAQGKFVAK